MRRSLMFLALMFLPIVFSQPEYFGIDSKIEDGSVITDFIVDGAEYFEFKVYGIISNYSSNVECRLESNIFKCFSSNETTINLRVKIENVIGMALNRNVLVQQFELRSRVKQVSCLVTLPVGMILVNETNSIFPENYRTLTNGRNIIVYWELENVSSYQPLLFKVTYSPAVTEEGIISILRSFYIVIIIIGFFLALLFYELLKAKRVVVKKIVKVPKEKIILEVLDPDEKKIYEIVQKEGKIKQSKLVELTGFSKARVSRVVKRLNEKKLIKIERAGKTNLILLNKK